MLSANTPFMFVLTLYLNVAKATQQQLALRALPDSNLKSF